MAPRFARGFRAFTLVELLVAIAILSMLVVMLFQIITKASDIWRSNRSRVEAFQAARTAFERVTRQLSQATLDTYLDYFDNSNQSRTDWARENDVLNGEFSATKYDWASDLQFVTGDASSLISGASGETPTQSVFFVAPTGIVDSDSVEYRNLDRLLNAMGFYIEFSSDSSEIPPFLRGHVDERYRYRLMEVDQPSEKLEIYDTSQFTGSGSWYNQAINNTDSPPYILADNVIALIFRPRVSTADSSSDIGTAVESSYAFDSKGYLTGGSEAIKNQLPPLMQVTMVTIDEVSADRYAKQHGNGAPDFVSAGLFSNPERFDDDLETLQKNLTDLKLNYRVFTTDVSLRGAKTNLND